MEKAFMTNSRILIWRNKEIWYEEIRYEERRRLATGQSEDCTTGCLLDCEYIKNRYRPIAVDLSGQKELDTDPKAIQ